MTHFQHKAPPPHFKVPAGAVRKSIICLLGVAPGETKRVGSLGWIDKHTDFWKLVCVLTTVAAT